MVTADRKLTPKETRFVSEFLIDGNGTRAATAAGYSARSAKHIAHEILRKPNVFAAIEAKTAKVLNKLDVTVERVLQERARLAFFDPRKLFDKDGLPLAVHELDDDTAAAVAGLEVAEDYIGTGDDRVVVSRTKKVKLTDKTASLTALEKHLGMYREESGGEGALSIHIHL